MKKIFLSVILVLIGVFALAQSVTVTFTGRDAKTQYVQLDRVVITNLTQNWQETIYYPDTILMMGSTGIDDRDANNSTMQLSQNVPNPFDGTTDFALQLPEAGKVSLTVYDLNGKKITAYQGKLTAGVHTFRVLLNTTQSYLLTARCGNELASLKMINNGSAGENAIRHLSDGSHSSLTALLKNGTKGATDKPFAFGDNMAYIGYATINGTESASQTVRKEQLVSETIVLDFEAVTIVPPTITTAEASNISATEALCGGTVEAEGDATVTERGVCYSTSLNPTIADKFVAKGSGVGDFTCKLSELTPSTTYHVRAYATTVNGTYYGDEKEFTTRYAQLPLALTGEISNVMTSMAECRGEVYDQGTYVFARGVCYGTSPNPTVDGDHTDDGEGPGLFDSRIFNLMGGTTYYVRAYATNGDGTAYGEEKSFTTLPCPSTVKDIDDNVYHTVGIGTQCWMKENLRTTRYADRTDIIKGSSETFSETAGRWYFPNDEESNKATYGLLYNWKAVMRNSASSNSNPSRVQGICPDGWHVPSEAEWLQMINFVGDQSEYLCSMTCSEYERPIAKALSSTSGWKVETEYGCAVGYNQSENNATGFSAVPAGQFLKSPDRFGWTVFYWSATLTSSSSYASVLDLFNSYSCINREYMPSDYIARANSVRCVFNDPNSEEDADAKPCPGTPTVDDVDGNTYNTVQIGEQCWMKENLKTTKYADGTDVKSSGSTATTEANWYYPNNKSSNKDAYGLLYNWKAVMQNYGSSDGNPSGVQGVCPNGWHVPSDAEWTQLTNYVSSQSKYVCGSNKAYIARALAATSGWNNYSGNCYIGNDQASNNATGFSAVPAGDYVGSYSNFTSAAFFWSTTDNGDSFAYGRDFYYYDAAVNRNDDYEKGFAFSVRCLKN